MASKKYANKVGVTDIKALFLDLFALQLWLYCEKDTGIKAT